MNRDRLQKYHLTPAAPAAAFCYWQWPLWSLLRRLCCMHKASIRWRATRGQFEVALACFARSAQPAMVLMPKASPALKRRFNANLEPAEPECCCVFEIIRHGIPGSIMPPHSLTDTENWMLVAYLQSVAEAGVIGLPAGTCRRSAGLY